MIDRRSGVLATLVLLSAFSVVPAQAQIFASYTCADGTPLAAAFFPNEKNMRLQVGGKSLMLPQRLSGSGARYAKGGVSFWIKGNEATLKRPKMKATLCKTQQ